MDERPVIPEHAVKSVSNEHTFEHDHADPEIIRKTLFRLSEKVAYRLRQQNLQGRTLHLKLRYEGFETTTRNFTFTEPTNNTEVIFSNISRMFSGSYQKNRKIRLLGVGMSGFDKQSPVQLSLFEKAPDSISRIDTVEDLIKKRFGKGSIGRAEGMKNE